MKFKFVLLLCALSGVIVTGTLARAQDDDTITPRFEPVICPSPMDTWSNFECGYLVVPADHAHPTGQSLRLMVAITHSRSATPAPDPVVILAGGPGNAAVGADGTSQLEMAILKDRDIIYLDQRGVGLSEPNLSCPELAGYVFDALEDQPVNIEEAYLARLTTCRDRLLDAGVDLSLYTTAQNAADVAALRVALGYDEWNLFGYSYGTRLALTVMRDYPDGIRSVILDSVYPPNAEPQLESSAIADEALESFFAACADDGLCNLLYPDLKTVYYGLFDKLNENPAEVTIASPTTGKEVKFQLDGHALSIGILQLLSDHGVIPYLPAIIYDFHHGDFSRVADLFTDLSKSNGLNGMAFSTMCVEEIPFTTASQLRAAADQYPEVVRNVGGFAGEFGYAVCETWLGDSINPDPVENEPVTSDIPTLILVGKYDLATPPRWGYLAAETLPNGVVYEFPATGHIATLAGACPVGMVFDFLHDPVTAPSDKCINGMRDLTFVASFRQTRPWAYLSASLLGLVAIGFVSTTTWTFARNPRQIAWITSQRLLGFLPAVLSAAGLGLIILVGGLSNADTLRLVEIVVSLAIAMSAVFVFSPPDDPPLEILLACPRPAWRLLIERLLICFVMQLPVALVGALLTLLVTNNGDVMLAYTRWVSPTLMLTGIAVYTTVRSRVAVFGAALTLLVWFALVMMGDALLPDTPIIYPFNYLQPWLWPFQPYLKPESLTSTDYVLNRIVVAASGICLLALTVYQLRDEEQVLFSRAKKPSKEA